MNLVTLLIVRYKQHDETRVFYTLKFKTFLLQCFLLR